MTRRPQGKPDPLEREIEAALDPGWFVSSRTGSEFVADLEVVAADVAALVDNAPARAVALYESFLAGCYEKAEEVDDSGARFGMFVADLFCGWIRARQANGADASETASRLLGWMDDDPYSLCYRIEEDVVTVLDKAGRAAFTEQVRSRFEQASLAVGSDENRQRAQADRRHWAEVLRTLYAARRNVGAYTQLAEDTGVTQSDCLAVAKMLSARRKPEEALAWVERGIVLDAQVRGSFAGRDLRELKVRLLRKLERGDEAVQTVWAAYEEHPSRFTYDDLMKVVPAGERDRWRGRALEAAVDADPHAHIELLLHVEETDRLAALVRGSSDGAPAGLWSYLVEEAATRLARRHPDAAARLWCAQALSILDEGKSKSYPGALRSLQRAKGCYEQAGRPDEWHRLVEEVRATHHRKMSFMPDFERLASGEEAGEEPSFLERAKARWWPPQDRG